MKLHPADIEFLQTFHDGTIPIAAWRHRSHLKVAYLFLCQFPFNEAVTQVRAGIQRYNAATNTSEALDRGYHETVTVAWMKLVHFAMSQHGPAASADEFIDAQEQLLNRKALRFFYSRDRIMTWEAKREFLPPDLTPFPELK